jgi:hypothetical protein
MFLLTASVALEEITNYGFVDLEDSFKIGQILSNIPALEASVI